MTKNYTKITIQDIEIAENFFENDKHLDEFLANVCRYYSGKTITIKSKIVQKYFETYKKTMDNVILARDYGKNGGAKRIENQHIENDTLEGSVEAPLQPKVIEVNKKEIEINIKEILENQIEEIYELYPTKCPIKKKSTGKNVKNKKQIEVLIKNNSFENIKTRLKNYVDDCEKHKVWIKNFSTILNQLPEIEEETIKETITNDTIVVFTDDDDIDKNREHKVRKQVFDSYLERNKPVKFVRYAGI